MRISGLTFGFILALSPALGGAVDDPPRRRPGLWELRTEMNGRASAIGPIESCVDEKTDDLMRQSADNESIKCAEQSWRREGDKIIVNSVCKMERSTITMRGVFSGDFNSSYRGELHSTYDPPFYGTRERSFVISAKWLGPCRRGQKAGDIATPGAAAGGKINIEELMKARDQMKARQQR